MAFFDFMKRKKTENAQLVLPMTTAIRKGMWIRYKENTGILADFNPMNGGIELHIVDPVEGTTIRKEMIFDTMAIRQAKLSEIPEKRRPSPERAARFGYTD